MLKRLFGIGLVAAVLVPFAAMAQDATPEMEMMAEPIELPAVDPLEFSGDIIVAGSSTVFPLTEAVANQFSEEGFAGEITIDSIGSGAGFERFCETAETDISNASRAIEEDELAACEANGRPALEFRVGTDALAVVVSSANDFLESLTIEQLASIYTGEFTTWDQVDPSFPAETIQLFSPGSDSGTFDYFIEAVVEGQFEGDDAGDLAAAAVLGAPGIQLSEDDNVLVQGVEGSPYAIAYFGYAYFNENADLLTAIAIDAGDGPIAPNGVTAEDGSYPIARPLFIYSAAEVIAEKPQVGAFISYYLSNVNDLIVEVGYFPASVEALNAAKEALMSAMGMGM
ncbi:MAG: PstS family phosphate ABC transporter substrate-binding protein [Pleurocapsa minor GSE-CHR-MK-17-07R]|jgi:phosphate transport system substrate-binding protein|nr:PstS family phosphate ABC transporter substrate-binding protein [Pleurocapsa minor GSE-CHR-MK 17-07R]